MLHLFRNQWHTYFPFIFYMPHLSIAYQTTSRLGGLWQQPSVRCQFCSLFCAQLSTYSVSLTWSHSRSFLVIWQLSWGGLTHMSGASAGVVVQAEYLSPCHPSFTLGLFTTGWSQGSKRVKLKAVRPVKVLFWCRTTSTTFYWSKQVTVPAQIQEVGKDFTSGWEELQRILIYHFNLPLFNVFAIVMF